MFLRRLHLKNIRSIGQLDLSFTLPDGQVRGWTYLLGENGAGKSTVLKAIALAMSGSEALLRLVDEPDKWIRLGEPDARIEIEFATADSEARQVSLDFRAGMQTFDFLAFNRQALGQLDAAVAKSDRNYFVVGYGVTRHAQMGGTAVANERGTKGIPPRARAVATLFNVDAALVSLEQWAMDLDYRRGDEGISAVARALDTLLPGVRFSHIDRERRRLMFETEDGALPLAALSDGYQAMAAWCGDLLFQITETFEDYRDPLKARGLLLVDEIDLHLHPVWQRRLVAFIKETLPNVQVIVTTHSPLTVHQAGAGELFLLKRNGPEPVTVVPFEGAPNLMMLHQLLQSPLFGLETLDSPQVQEARQEIRDLQGIGKTVASAAPNDRARLAELEQILADVPSWMQTRPDLERTNDVLEKLARHIAGDGSGSGTPSPDVLEGGSA